MDKLSQATLFKPHGELDFLAEHVNHIPHYLFRTSAPKTNGTTTSQHVESAAAKYKSLTTDLLSRPMEEAAEMLEDHCLWKNRRDDNLTSWTSSFLFAIQLAIYRRFKDWDEPSPASINIHILDTRKLPPGTFLSAEILLGAYEIAHDKLKHAYRRDEYLSQGCISIPEGAMATITYQSLIDCGLHELYPHFTDKGYHGVLRHRVNQLRQLFKNKMPEVPTTMELRITQRIANQWCSADLMRPVVMTLLLSLKPRFRLDPETLEAFRTNSWRCFITDKSLDDLSVASNFVEEYRQFVDVMYDIHADTQRQRQLESARPRVRTTADVTEAMSHLTGKSNHLSTPWAMAD